VILGIDADAPDFARHLALGQRLGPVWIHLKFGNARLRPNYSGRENRKHKCDDAQGNLESGTSSLGHFPQVVPSEFNQK